MFEKPFKNIVVGVDFSPYSKIVVKQARILCHMYDAKLILVHGIIDFLNYSELPYVALNEIVSTDEIVTRMKKYYDVNNFSTLLIAKFGTPEDTVIEVAKKYHNALIMVGHRGHRSLLQFVLGSTAKRLAQDSKYSVWIHRGNKAIEPQRILVPHDLSKQSNHSIKLIKKMALSRPLNYEVFYVKQTPFPILDYKTYSKMNRRMLNKTKHSIHKLLSEFPHIPFVSSSGDVNKKIVKRSKDFDLILMSHHNKGLFSHSETIELMKKVHVPILITH